MSENRKITFQEAWDSATVFFLDEELEADIDAKVSELLAVAQDPRIAEASMVNDDAFFDFLLKQPLGLDVILKDIELSEEKFMLIISLLRRLKRIPGDFDVEWGISKIKSKIVQESAFAQIIGQLLLDGKRDQELAAFIPRYYLETLNYRQIKESSTIARQVRYKKSLIGTYAGLKGYKVEEKIHQKLREIQSRYGVPFNSGRSRIIETNIDFAVPGVDDPWVIIMSSFQETTSSGQTTKARDMLSAYERVLRNNSRYGENRVFVNFVDGGGWLARKRDFERLVNQCNYYINLALLDILEGIVLQYVPKRYFNPKLI
jgi:hypothetical protein